MKLHVFYDPSSIPWTTLKLDTILKGDNKGLGMKSVLSIYISSRHLEYTITYKNNKVNNKKTYLHYGNDA